MRSLILSVYLCLLLLALCLSQASGNETESSEAELLPIASSSNYQNNGNIGAMGGSYSDARLMFYEDRPSIESNPPIASEASLVVKALLTAISICSVISIFRAIRQRRSAQLWLVGGIVSAALIAAGLFWGLLD
jgi:hypothetical protein